MIILYYNKLVNNYNRWILMKVILKYLKYYIKESILSPAFKLLEAVLDLLVPVVVARMIDGAVGAKSGGITAETGGSAAMRYFFVLVIMAVVGLSACLVAQYFAAKASAGAAGRLRQDMFSKIQTFSFCELDRFGTDTLITRLSDDVNQVQTGLNMGLRLLLRSPFIVFGAMIMAFTVDVECALVFAVTVPLLFAAVFTIMFITIPLYTKVQSSLDKVTLLTRENLSGVRVIRAFCREDRSVEEFETASDYLTRLNLFVGRISTLMNPLTYVIINIGAAVMINEAGIRVNIGALTTGQTVALYNYMLQITIELIKLATLVITLNRSIACASRAGEILNTKTSMEYPSEDNVARGAALSEGLSESMPETSPEDIPEGTKKKTPADIGTDENTGNVGYTAADEKKAPTCRHDRKKEKLSGALTASAGENPLSEPNEATAAIPAVCFKNVTFCYPSAAEPSVKNAEFSVLPGQRVGIIGATASGKTSLVNLISRFYDPQNGEVLLFGKNIKNYSREWLSKNIGVVQQKNLLFSGTVRENLKWGDENADDETMWQSLKTAQAESVIKDKPGGLDFYIEATGRNLSGGQRQRLCIARALVKKPKILILDDSSSALDLATDAALKKALLTLKNTTVFTVSQRISGVRDSDIILVIDGGEIVGKGTHDELMENSFVYKGIYDSQFPDGEGGDGCE